MVSASLSSIQKELHDVKKDLAFLKHVLAEQYHLSGWAKKELAKARKVPDAKLLSHEHIKNKILAK